MERLNMSKRVITVDGSQNGSKWFETAIFIVNGSALPQVDLASEAERIVAEYSAKAKFHPHADAPIKHLAYKKKNPVSRGLDKTYSFLLICLIVTVMLILFTNMM
jgi:hypothetical protein